VSHVGKFCWLITLLAALSGMTMNGRAEEHKMPLRLGLGWYLGEATNFYALDSGLFEQQGLTISVTRNHAGFQSLKQLMRGELDIVTVAATPVVYATMGSFGSGRPFSIAASILKSSTLNFVVGAQGAGIHLPEDLRGKKIGIKLKSASEYLWSLFSRYHEIDVENITFVDLPGSKMPDAMARGEIDAAVTWAPFHEKTAAAAPGGGVIFQPLQIYNANWLVVVDTEFAVGNPQTVTAYLTALKLAEEVLRRQPEQVARIQATYVQSPAADLQKLYELAYFDLSLDEGLLLTLSLQGQWAAKRGYVPMRDVPDFRPRLNPTWLSKVKPGAVTLME